MPSLLEQLAVLDRKFPTEHKLFLCPDISYGRELLQALALREGGWLGWEPTTLRQLADQLAFVAIGERGLKAGTDLAIAAVVDRAIGQVLARGEVNRAFAGLARSPGFRRALGDALLQLRNAGIDGRELLRVAEPGSPAADLARVELAYAPLLLEAGLLDSAGVFRLALERFEAEAPFILPGTVVIAADFTERGLRAELLARLRPGAAAELVREAAPAGAATLDLFRAATPLDELREVARRIREEGLRWDEVEIVATDLDAYGVALDVLAATGGLPVSMLEGIPLARSRLGRALERWFHWLTDGLPADRIRHALEAGDLGRPEVPWQPRAFRALGIGWGRPRYEAALRQLQAEPAPPLPRGRDSEDELTLGEWHAARAAVADLLARLLALTPPTPQLGSREVPEVPAGVLAGATRRYLDLIPPGPTGEAHARERLTGRLEELAALRTEPVPFGLALAEVREAIADFRVWPEPGTEGRPRQSGGGRLHLTGLLHAGTTGRPRVFVVGLDADRTAGPRVPDPILPDALRASFRGRLATTATRREESRALVARAVRGLGGRVTLSYAVEGEGGRESSPAALLLEMLRGTRADPTLEYQQLRAALGPPACAVPAAGRPPLDRRDSWLAAIAQGEVLLDGTAPVAALHPGLARGLAALAAWGASELGPHHGLVPGASGLDPRRRPGQLVSASSLEQLARCPRAWLYSTGLRLRPPDDPVYTPDVWLDEAERGTLFHDVLEAFGRAFHERQGELATPAAEAALLAIGRAQLLEKQAEIPAPSELTVTRMAAWLEESLRSFLAMELEARRRSPGGAWQAYELAFGWRGERSASFTLPGGVTLGLIGRIDRVDRLGGGGLVVIDYKSGSPAPYRKDAATGPFAGGRHLQAGLYAAAAGQLLGEPVARFEYRFPTQQGERKIVSFDGPELARTGEVVTELLDEVAAGRFLPTTDPADCRFCAFGPVCRVREGSVKWSRESPRADWARETAATLPEYRPMLRRRGEDPA